MSAVCSLIHSSLGKKYLMALTGLVLVGFVLGHMLGNLQIFIGPETLNTYAHKLQTLPGTVLWGARLFLLLCLVVHVWVAVVLTKQNRAARPQGYLHERTVQATYSSRTMPMTGFILLAFIIFHLLHYTARVIYDYEDPDVLPPYTLSTGEEVLDVYSMMIVGFSHWWVSLFYIVSMGLLCMHLSHGVSSMFQSVGLRNQKWRPWLKKFATFYGIVIFIGFASIPFAVMAGLLEA